MLRLSLTVEKRCKTAWQRGWMAGNVTGMSALPALPCALALPSSELSLEIMGLENTVSPCPCSRFSALHPRPAVSRHRDGLCPNSGPLADSPSILDRQWSHCSSSRRYPSSTTLKDEVIAGGGSTLSNIHIRVINGRKCNIDSKFSFF